uniref:protein acetyllysine N-acetyltransferase n=1 Tax=Anopheles atroparvus TaxID=41427 RepID=A0A182JG02_ANOAO
MDVVSCSTDIETGAAETGDGGIASVEVSTTSTLSEDTDWAAATTSFKSSGSFGTFVSHNTKFPAGPVDFSGDASTTVSSLAEVFRPLSSRFRSVMDPERCEGFEMELNCTVPCCFPSSSSSKSKQDASSLGDFFDSGLACCDTVAVPASSALTAAVSSPLDPRVARFKINCLALMGRSTVDIALVDVGATVALPNESFDPVIDELLAVLPSRDGTEDASSLVTSMYSRFCFLGIFRYLMVVQGDITGGTVVVGAATETVAAEADATTTGGPIFDLPELIETKCEELAKMILASRHTVVHTGAGISTSAGIPDFRGPKGVWTLEEKGEKPSLNVSFDEAIPTKTHMALKALVATGHVQYIVSQNIDGLHLRSGLARDYLSELHGNMFVELCTKCRRQYVRSTPAPTVGKKLTGNVCRASGKDRGCRGGNLIDNILDWEHDLPENDLQLAFMHSAMAELNICLGTTLQIVPSGDLPLKNQKYGGQLVICNLQPTKHDKKADMKISAYVDVVLEKVVKRLGIEIPEYDPADDPTKRASYTVEWGIVDRAVKKMDKLYDKMVKEKGKLKKRTPVSIDDKDKEEVKKNTKKRKQEEAVEEDNKEYIKACN